MPRTLVLLVTMLAVLALGATACSEQEPDVTEEEQVTAEDRPEEDADQGGGGGGGGDGDGGGDGGGVDGTFVAVDIDWEEAPETLPAGEVTLELDNQGSIDHDLTVEELGDEEVVEDIAGGESGTGTVELEPGEYTFYCDVGTHREAGMETTVTVE